MVLAMAIDRRRRAAPRPRQVPGRVRRGVRRGQRARPADRRLLRRQPQLALGVLRQPAGRRDRAGRRRDRRCAPSTAHRKPVIDYLGTFLIAAAASCLVLITSFGGSTWAWSSWQVYRLRGAGGGAAGRVVLRGETRAGAGAAAAPVPELGVRHVQHHRLRRRLVHVRRADLPAAVPAGRARRHAHRLRPAAAAADGRRAGRLDRLGPADQPDRPVQDLPDRRHGGDDGRRLAPVPDDRHHLHGLQRGRDAGLRPRAGPGHAGAGHRGAEHGRLRGPRHGHQRA